MVGDSPSHIGRPVFNDGTLTRVVSFDLVEVTQFLWCRKWSILLMGVVGATLAVGFALVLAPRYQASGQLVVYSDALVSSDSNTAFDSTPVNDAVVTTEQETLTADGLLRRVASGLELPPSVVNDSNLGANLINLLINNGIISGGFKATLNKLFPVDQSTPDLLSAKRAQFLANSLTVVANKGSSVISVRATTADPALSAAIVNKLMQLYMQDRSAEQSLNAQLILHALRDRLTQTRQEIAQGEDNLVQMLQRPGAVDNSEIPGLMQQIALVGDQLIQAQAELSRRQADYDAARKMLRDADHALPDASSGVTVELRRQVAQLEAELASDLANEGPNHPDVQARRQQIKVLQSEIAAEANRGVVQRQSDLLAAQATVDSLEHQLDAVRKQRQQQAAGSVSVERQREAVASLWRISDSLEGRLIDLAAEPANANARILTAAVPPTQPSFPRKSMFAAAGFLLTSVCTAVILLLTAHFRRLQPAALQLALQMNAPLLGGLPLASRSRGIHRRLLRSAIEGNSQDGSAETLCAVALELEDAVKEGHLRCVMVTSAYSGEGKTTVAAALSRSLAAMSMRVLLVDLDLRRPSAERMFLSSAPNVFEPQIQRIGPGDVLQVQVDRASGLHMMTPFPDGCTDPITYLRSPQLRDRMKRARDYYDLLVFDTPPMMAVPDGRIIARLSDGIVLVTELGRSNGVQSAEMLRRLASTRLPLCGVIVTKVRVRNSYVGSYTGYGRVRT